jgi:hypothetical protein
MSQIPDMCLFPYDADHTAIATPFVSEFDAICQQLTSDGLPNSVQTTPLAVTLNKMNYTITKWILVKGSVRTVVESMNRYWLS